MTYEALIQKFLEMVAKIKALNPAYKQPGDGSNGVCDCIGLIIGAIRRMGLKWLGIHGSNYAARYQTVGLSYIESESQLELGDVVYKAADQNGVVKLACNAGTKKHKWELPSRYMQGKSYYNGDLHDYYHVGTVTQVHPIRITHMTSPRMKVDINLTGGWNYHGKAKPIVNAVTSGTKPAETAKPDIKPPENVATTGSEAVVWAENGCPVKLREYPSTSCRTWDSIPVGTKVTVVDPGEDWCKLNCKGRKGWYMMSKFVDIVGDGKGRY